MPKPYDAEKRFEEIQKKFRLNLRQCMTEMSDHHEKMKDEGMPIGMGESLFFALMWDEFTQLYKEMVPTKHEDETEFLKSLFNSIMEDGGPMAYGKKPTNTTIN